MKTGRESTLDIARGAAITAVVLVHAVALWPVPEALHLGGTATIALAVLFLVSGHLAGQRLLTSSAKPADVAARIVPLLWLYAVWQPVVLVQRIVLAATEGGTVSLAGELGRALAAPIRPNGELWYLWALAIHLVVLWSTRRVAPAFVLVPAAVLFVVCNGAGRELLGDQTWHVLGPGLQGLPQFAFFTFLGARLPTLVPRWRSGALAVAAGACAAGLGGLELSGLAMRMRPVETLIGVALVLALSGLCRQVDGHHRGFVVLGFVGSRSVAPYLGHMSVLTAIVCILAGLDRAVSERLPPVLCIAAAVVAAVAIPLALLQVSRRWRAEWLFRAPPVVVDLLVGRIERRTGHSTAPRRR